MTRDLAASAARERKKWLRILPDQIRPGMTNAEANRAYGAAPDRTIQKGADVTWLMYDQLGFDTLVILRQGRVSEVFSDSFIPSELREDGWLLEEGIPIDAGD